MNTKKYRYKLLIYVFIFLLVFFTPCVIFAVIAFSNNSLTLFFNLPKNYQGNSSDLGQLINFNVLPSQTEFYGLIISGLVLFLISFPLLAFSFIEHRSWLRQHKYYKAGWLIVTSLSIVMLGLSFILMSIAEYNYGWFTVWIQSLHSEDNIMNVVNNSNVSDKKGLISLLNNIFNTSQQERYGWIPIMYVEVFAGFQISCSLFLVIRTRTKIYNVVHTEFNTSVNKTKKHSTYFNVSYWQLRFTNFFQGSYRNVCFWILIGLSIVTIPYIIYIMILYIPSSNIHKFIYYFYIYHMLFNNMGLFNGASALANDYYNTPIGNGNQLFIVTQLPALMLFLTGFIISLYFWMSSQNNFSTAGQNVAVTKQRYYTFLVIFTICLEVLSIAVFSYSQINIAQGVTFWNNHFNHVINKFIFNDNKAPYLWLRSTELYASIAIVFAFSAFFSTVALFSIFRISKSQKATKIIKEWYLKSE